MRPTETQFAVLFFAEKVLDEDQCSPDMRLQGWFTGESTKADPDILDAMVRRGWLTRKRPSFKGERVTLYRLSVEGSKLCIAERYASMPQDDSVIGAILVRHAVNHSAFH